MKTVMSCMKKYYCLIAEMEEAIKDMQSAGASADKINYAKKTLLAVKKIVITPYDNLSEALWKINEVQTIKQQFDMCAYCGVTTQDVCL